ncbi:uncharacterized protein [Epargyreus clarus]|uniref:uncharacterized protein isoform X2 n=1 Tax=Epargyreus clarus TaxID=520877 RepID=UPI003C2B3E66
MPAARKIAQGQLECLVGWMQSNPLVARGAFLNTPQGKQRAGALWEELASRLNAMPVGCTKSAKEWRQMGDDVLELEKRRVALEERRLALEERRLEQKQRFEERWLALEERRFEDEQRWRHDILDTLKGIAETLF